MADSGRKLLFLAPFAPNRDAAHGGGRTMAGLISQLAARNRVQLLCLRAAGEPPVDASLRETCEEVLELPRAGTTDRSSGLGQRLGKHGRTLQSLLTGRPRWASYCAVPQLSAALRERVRSWQPDLVQMECAVMGQYAADLTGSALPTVLNHYDPGAASARELWQASRGAARVAARLDLRARERFERNVIREMSAVVTLTEHDRRTIRRLSRKILAVTIPLGIELPAVPASPEGSGPPSLLFVGSFHHPLNVEAAARLIRGIFPEVLKRVPDAALYLIGGGLPDALVREAGPAVIVMGRVERVEPYLEHAAVVVAPLSEGGGMRVKVLEALAAGKAVVASPRAVAGLDAVSLYREEAVTLAWTNADYVDAISSLLTDREQRIAQAFRARSWAKANLGWDRAVAAYEALYDKLLARRRRTT